MALIFAATLFVYWPSLGGDWLWDDHLLIVSNQLVHSTQGWWQIWLQPGQLVDYFPLTVTAQWIEWHLLGNHPLGYRLINLALHLTSSLLVWRLLAKFNLRQAWLGGLIFAIHPALVESVAWIAELKNTLSLPPFLLAMMFWIDYEEKKRARDYGAALGLFLIAMLAKTTLAMFPLVILLYAWWKRQRIGWNDLRDSAPFFVISLVLGLVTLWFLHHSALRDETVDLGGLGSRLARASCSLTFYVSTCLWPSGLLTVYPQWKVDPFSWTQWLMWPVLAGLIYACWSRRLTWGRHGLLGLGFFVLMLLPFLGLNAASYMRFTWVMDHLLYVPILGLIGLTVAGYEALTEHLSREVRLCSWGVTAAILVILALLSRSYANLYLNQELLWNHTLEHNPRAWIAYMGLGIAERQRKNLEGAIAYYRESLRIDPEKSEVWLDLGEALLKTGHVDESIQALEKSIALSPHRAEAIINLGQSLLQKGDVATAMIKFKEALALDPHQIVGLNSMGVALNQAGHPDEGIEYLRKALEIDPHYTDAQNNLGVILTRTGQLAEAVNHFEAALKIDPGFVEVHTGLGHTLYLMHRIPEAIEHEQMALKLSPDYTRARLQLGMALLQNHQPAEGVEQLRIVVQAYPKDANALNQLGVGLAMLNQTEEAEKQFEAALQADPTCTPAQDNLRQLRSLKSGGPPR